MEEVLDENAPINNSEMLLRIVFCNNLKTQSKLKQSLKPKAKEITGISLYRKACLHNPAQCLEITNDQDCHGVVEISKALLDELGLTVVPKKEDKLPGHCEISELHANCDWNSLTSVVDRIAGFAINNIIVHPKKSGKECQKH